MKAVDSRGHLYTSGWRIRLCGGLRPDDPFERLGWTDCDHAIQMGRPVHWSLKMLDGPGLYKSRTMAWGSRQDFAQ